jgi:hypothetical protein
VWPLALVPGHEWYEDSHNYRVLKKYLAADQPGENGWFDLHCPLHEDQKRSAGVNFEKNRWSCRAGCGSGTIYALVQQVEAMEMAESWSPESGTTGGFDDATVIELDSRRGKRKQEKGGKPPATPDQVEEWAAVLASDEAGVLGALVELRGIGEATLAAFSIGYSIEHRAYTIPVWSADEKLLNVRMYRPGAARTKIWNWEGMDPSAIYPEKVLKENDRILICEGEWDALIAIDRGFPAVTGTTGAVQWMSKWNRKFEGKDVLICYDRDETGDIASAKVARSLEKFARSVVVVELPLQWSNKHGLDVTDFFHKEGRTPEEFASVLGDARVYAAPKDGEPVKVSVKESYAPGLSGLPMAMTVSVVGKGNQTHLVPSQVTFSCSMNAGPKCHGCPMADADGEMKEDVDPKGPVVLALRDVGTAKRDDVLREEYGIHKCGKMEVDVRSYVTTEMLVVRTSIEEDLSDDDHRSRTIVNVGEYRTDTNSIVRLTGTTYPSPSGQESVFLSWHMDHMESSLDTFALTGADVELMKRFRPSPGQDPLKKLGQIARELATHVTHIYDRTALHIAMDLVFHSALTFRFGDDVLERGWLELLVVGDARTGKSEVAGKLTKHYRLGRMVSCESASIPGLLGAVKPLVGSGNKGWTLEWGAIPLNDRRLVVLDEVSGLAPEQIGALSSLRSSGIAEIVKAEREVTRARTRLIWLSNPRNNVHGMAGYMYGVQSILPLIGTQEDVARFDLATTLGTDDVPSDMINRRRSITSTLEYTSEACHALLSWVWSRTRDQIVWDKDAEDEVYRAAMRMGEEYVPAPPLVQMQNVRVKIARVATAIAARTFSSDKSSECVLVTKAHVEAAVRFIDHIYGVPTFGYKEISRRIKDDSRAANSEKGFITDYLEARPLLARFLVSCGGTFRRQQVEEMMNHSKEEANAIIMQFTSRGMLHSTDDTSYRISPELNDVLRKMKI